MKARQKWSLLVLNGGLMVYAERENVEKERGKYRK